MLNQQIKHYVGIFNLYACLFHFNSIFSSFLYFDTLFRFFRTVPEQEPHSVGLLLWIVKHHRNGTPLRLYASVYLPSKCIAQFSLSYSHTHRHIRLHSLDFHRTSFLSYLLLCIYMFQNIKLKIHQRKCEKGKTLHKRIFNAPWQWDEISNEYVARNTRYRMRCAAHMHSPETKHNEESAEQIQIYGVRV